MSKSTEGLNFSVSNMSGANRKPSNLITITLEKVIAWLKKKGLDEPVEKELIKMASVYPQNALENWMKNFQMHLVRARSEVQKKHKIEVVELEELNELEEKIDLDSDSIGKAPVFDEF